MDAGGEAGISRSRRAREELAKAWLLDVMDRTPLTEADEVPVSWIAEQAPELIGDILRGVSGAEVGELELPAAGIERVGELGRLRRRQSATRIPRDLAALQGLMIEALRRDVPERRLGAFAASVGRLAEIFGDIQAQVNEELVRERSGGPGRDPLTGLAGEAELHEWLRILLAEHRRYGHPFALLFIDVQGLGRINEAYGRDSGDRMVAAVAEIVKHQIRAVDCAFRLAGGELVVLSPHQHAEALRRLGERFCDVVDRSQAKGGPRVAIAAGIASCPEHAEDAEGLLGAAEEAAWAAKAAGRGVGIGSHGAA